MKYFFFLSLFLVTTSLLAQNSEMKIASGATLKTESYFSKIDKDFNSQLLLVLAYKIEQFYGCKTKLSITSKLNKSTVFDDEKNSIFFLKRLINKNSKVSREQLNASNSDLEKLMNWSLSADRFRINKEYENLLISLSQLPDRNTAHTALCLAWLKDLNELQNFHQSDSVIKRHITLLTEMMQKESPGSDNQLEAVMGLLVLEQKALIPDSIFQNIVSHQNEDGGWPLEQTPNAPSNAHASILAYWILQDYMHHGKKLVSWFQ